MRPAMTMAIILGFAASAALAHVGVKDPQVKARMDGMKTMAADLKKLGLMARGVTPFDAANANAALLSLKTENDRIPALFAPAATDPKSEARPAVWTDPAGFAQRTAEMGQALDAMTTSSASQIAASLRNVGAACSACHEAYRVRKTQ